MMSIARVRAVEILRGDDLCLRPGEAHEDAIGASDESNGRVCNLLLAVISSISICATGPLLLLNRKIEACPNSPGSLEGRSPMDLRMYCLEK